jgi:protein-S-isoprenylcysteine O-methyltransferase Ste14
MYFIPVGIYAYVVVDMNQPTLADYCALGLTVFGVALSAKAKIDLGQNHTWAGRHFPDAKLVTVGIYKYLRHLLYTGICLSICGAVITTIIHAHWWMSMIVCVPSVGVVWFLVLRARLETKALEPMRGADTVHPESLVLDKR